MTAWARLTLGSLEVYLFPLLQLISLGPLEVKDKVIPVVLLALSSNIGWILLFKAALEGTVNPLIHRKPMKASVNACLLLFCMLRLTKLSFVVGGSAIPQGLQPPFHKITTNFNDYQYL